MLRALFAGALAIAASCGGGDNLDDSSCRTCQNNGSCPIGETCQSFSVGFQIIELCAVAECAEVEGDSECPADNQFLDHLSCGP